MIRDNYLDVSKIIKERKMFRLFRAVEAYGGVLRFVGGAVRDAIAGIESYDVDLATDLSPDELVEACSEKGLRTIPIGIKYGTVGVVIDDNVFEVTSLRRDVKTDGRHAIVEFTDNWEVDASRRDLTINAVYADEKGNVFDYYNGIEDLENGVVRFIGNPDQRIKEDYLRILRFFRFHSIFGKGEMDKKALEACVKNRDGLKALSIERVCDEIKKIIVTANAVKTIKVMSEKDILRFFLPESANLGELEFLVNMTNKMSADSKVVLRIFVLYLPDEDFAENLALRLRLNKKQKEALVTLARVNPTLEELLDEKTLLKYAYKYCKEFCRDKLLISLAVNKKELPDLAERLKNIEDFIIPVFPIRGKDIIAAGVVDSKKIGKCLDTLEKEWIDSDFSLNRDELLAKIDAI